MYEASGEYKPIALLGKRLLTFRHSTAYSSLDFGYTWEWECDVPNVEKPLEGYEGVEHYAWLFGYVPRVAPVSERIQ